METKSFRDRRHAGDHLGRALVQYAGRDDVVVLGLPRGGVPVGFEIATRLRAPLDVLVVRKLGVPGHEELAMGAIASGGIQVLDREVIKMARVSQEAINAVIARETTELERREQVFRGGRPAPSVAGKIVILVDDGLATGSTMLAAIEALRTKSPAQIVAAVPIAAPDTCEALRSRVDHMVCLVTPPEMRAVGYWYDDFTPTPDTEVRVLLDQAERQRSGRRPAGPGAQPRSAGGHR